MLAIWSHSSKSLVGVGRGGDFRENQSLIGWLGGPGDHAGWSIGFEQTLIVLGFVRHSSLLFS